MMTDTSKAIRSISLKLGTDLIYFEPDEERHIDGPTVMFAISTILASQFLTGFCDQARQVAYDAGKSTFDWLRKRVSEAYEGKQPVALDQVKQQASESGEIASKLTQPEVADLAGRAEALLAAELEQFGLPPLRARALAAHVRSEALLLAAEADQARENDG
jgi:hypothetical protein